MRYFCTYFDENFISNGRALIYSIQKYHKNFHIYVCAMSAKAEKILKFLNLSNLTIVNKIQLEKYETKLRPLKQKRSRIEYYFTCTPILISYLLKNHNLPYLEYIDADMFFFSSSKKVFQNLQNVSVAITPHRFARTKDIHEKYGRFNVGWMFFRNDKSGWKCLNWWSSQCLKWCFDRIEGKKYADQKYLDEFPEKFSKVASISINGFNEAPWNVDPKKVIIKNGNIYVSRSKLILFHFSGLKRLFWRIYDPCWSDYKIIPTHNLVCFIYRKYLNTLLKYQKESPFKNNIRKETSATELFKTKNIISALNEVRKRLQKNIYIFAPLFGTKKA